MLVEVTALPSDTYRVTCSAFGYPAVRNHVRIDEDDEVARSGCATSPAVLPFVSVTISGDAGTWTARPADRLPS